MLYCGLQRAVEVVEQAAGDLGAQVPAQGRALVAQVARPVPGGLEPALVEGLSDLPRRVVGQAVEAGPRERRPGDGGSHDRGRPVRPSNPRAMRFTVMALLVLLLAPQAAAEDYVQIIEGWRARRTETLRKPDGWLSLVGLHWLGEGPHRLGSDPKSDIVLPAGAPATVGTLEVSGKSVTLTAAPGVDLRMGGERRDRAVLEASDDPAVVTVGTMSFQVVERTGRLALRVRDSQSPALQGFQGTEWFPVDPRWRVKARFEPYSPARTVQVPNYTGVATSETSPGVLVFTLGGQEHRLEALGSLSGKELFLVFGDRTNGKSTYSGGRFLYVAVPDAKGGVWVDFNRAYSPPCAFTPYATCPLPPAQNRLEAEIQAGEKAPAH